MKSKGFLGGAYCVYLDQFAVSNFVGLPPGWELAAQAVEKAVAMGKIICPVSPEHLVETAGKSDENAVAHHNYLTSLSQGHVLKQEPFITAQLLISAIRGNNVTRNTFFEKIRNEKYDYQNHLTLLRNVKTDFDKMMVEAAGNANAINAMARGHHDKTFQAAVFDFCMAGCVAEFSARVKQLLLRGGFYIRNAGFKERPVPHYVDLILDTMLKRHKMTMKEVHKLDTYFSSKGFSGISTLDTRFTLGAHNNAMGKKRDASSQVDIGRIATAIQVSDIMFVDKARKFEINETGLARKYNTIVFSGTAGDVAAFTALIHQLTGA